MSLGGTLSSSTGAVWLSAGGPVTQPAGSLSTPALQLTGTGSYALDAAGNQLQTVAANTGALTLHSATDVASGSVLATTGISAAGPLTLLSDGALTIGAGAPISGASPALSAGTSFANNAGPAGLVASSGRWLVYAADPASSSFGGLDSANTALWNATYALTPPGSVGAAGNRYLFALQPTLTFSAVDATKVYGTDATAALQSNFVVAGYHAGVAGAFLGDSASTAYSGAPLLSSPGAAATASVAGGPYALSLAGGSVTSPAGYALSFTASPAQLSVTPRPITVIGGSLTRLYGDPNPSLPYTLGSGSLVNGDTLTGALQTSAGPTSPVGTYAIAQGTLDAGSNYALTYAQGTLTVSPRATFVDGGIGDDLYAAAPTPPGSEVGDEPGPDTQTLHPESVTPSDPQRYIVVALDDIPAPAGNAGPAGRGHPLARKQPGTAAQVMAALEHEQRLVRIAMWPIPAMRLLCVLYRLPDDAARERLLASLNQHRHVRVAEPLQEFAPLSDPEPPQYNDPYAPLQRGFKEIDAAGAQRFSVGRDVPVAVIDTAVDTSHPDLRGRVAASSDMIEARPNTERAQARHGTEVAGIISAAENNREGIVGVAPEARISAYRACWYPNGAASARCNSFTLAKALASVMDTNARIVNLSLGGPPDGLLALLTRKLVEQGRIVVAALPPSGRTEGFPSSVPGVLVVGSSDKADLPRGVLAAPGRDILTLTPGGAYDFDTGSSLATAHVSGAAALLLALDPSLSAADVQALLASNRGASGAINAAEAVAALMRKRALAVSRQP
jgi:subtilisin family serine protease